MEISRHFEHIFSTFRCFGRYFFYFLLWIILFEQNMLIFQHFLNDMRLLSGDTWSIPITLDFSDKEYPNILKANKILLAFHGKNIAKMKDIDVFQTSDDDIQAVYGTVSTKHPGVRKEEGRGMWRLGGNICLIDDSVLKNTL